MRDRACIGRIIVVFIEIDIIGLNFLFILRTNMPTWRGK